MTGCVTNLEEEEEEEDDAFADVEGLPMLTALSKRLDPEIRSLLTSVIDGRKLLSKGFIQESMERLHLALKTALREELPPGRFSGLRGEASKRQDKERAGPRPRFPAVVLPHTFPPKEPLIQPTAPTVEDLVGQILRLLCLCHSRAGDWRTVCEYADAGLEHNLVPQNGELRLELLLRRGIALSHLADVGPSRPPRRNELRRAEWDFQEVLKHRPRDVIVLRGLENVSFLKRQAALGDKFPKPPPLRGLARLRAMDA